ncbi:MAG: urea ABC transporter permease subunit UrtB, partial [Starkeya sp.]|nr:urea ABC transporter permease subunit UrtB [Starkeya sp.]
MKHWFWLVFAGLVSLLPVTAQAAPLDRAGLVAKMCGDAGAMGEAGTALATLAASGDEADRAWAAPLPR